MGMAGREGYLGSGVPFLSSFFLPLRKVPYSFMPSLLHSFPHPTNDSDARWFGFRLCRSSWLCWQLI